jgi:hypothetical protein
MNHPSLSAHMALGRSEPPTLDYRLELDPCELYRLSPPRWEDRNKQLVLAQVLTDRMKGCPTMVVSRWLSDPCLTSPTRLMSELQLVTQPTPFTYGRQESGVINWHMNFSDPNLLCAYGGPLLAQDEHQALEHPVLGALREFLWASPSHIARTVQAGRPTPILIARVPRLCGFDTQPSKNAPDGLYGWRFERAEPRQLLGATSTLHEATLSNLLCVAAPYPEKGPYRHETIAHILATATAGYRALIDETRRIWGNEVRSSVTTGYWGCGAFGGNRVLMSLLQLISARLAGLDRLVFCTVTTDGLEPHNQARQMLEARVSDWSRASSLNEVIAELTERAFMWGRSDGN